MAAKDAVKEALSPLPIFLRRKILSSVERQVEELRSKRIEREIADRMIAQTILQEIYFNTILPIEMAEKMIRSDLPDLAKGFKLEFSELTVDYDFLHTTETFLSDFYQLVENLGFKRSDFLRPNSNNELWKRRYARE